MTDLFAGLAPAVWQVWLEGFVDGGPVELVERAEKAGAPKEVIEEAWHIRRQRAVEDAWFDRSATPSGASFPPGGSPGAAPADAAEPLPSGAPGVGTPFAGSVASPPTVVGVSAAVARRQRMRADGAKQVERSEASSKKICDETQPSIPTYASQNRPAFPGTFCLHS